MRSLSCAGRAQQPDATRSPITRCPSVPASGARDSIRSRHGESESSWSYVHVFFLHRWCFFSANFGASSAAKTIAAGSQAAIILAVYSTASASTMSPDPQLIIIAPLVVAGAFVIFGITGFGSTIVAVPLLAHLMPLKFVIPMFVLLDFAAALRTGLKFRQSVAIGELTWLGL